MIKIEKQHDNYLLTQIDVTEANLNNSDKMKAEVIDLLDNYKKTLVIDMGKIEYMDSSFLGALVSALKHAIGVKSDIILVNMKKDIFDLFALIRLDKVFKIYKHFDDIPRG